MVIERWHGVHQIRGWQTGLFLLIPCRGGNRRRESMGRSRYSGPWPRRPIQCVDNLPSHHVRPRLKAVPSASRSPGLHRPNSRHRLHGAATASATAVLQCTLFVSSRNPSEQGRSLVFYTDPIAQSPADFRSFTSSYSTIAPQRIPEKIPAPSLHTMQDHQLTACEGPLCARRPIPQCYNPVTVRLRRPEAPGGSYDPITTRWPFPFPKRPCL
jgi:hypothetical protein